MKKSTTTLSVTTLSLLGACLIFLPTPSEAGQAVGKYPAGAGDIVSAAATLEGPHALVYIASNGTFLTFYRDGKKIVGPKLLAPGVRRMYLGRGPGVVTARVKVDRVYAADIVGTFRVTS